MDKNRQFATNCESVFCHSSSGTPDPMTNKKSNALMYKSPSNMWIIRIDILALLEYIHNIA